MPTPRPKRTAAQVGIAQGFRSGLEDQVSNQLKGLGVRVQYEPGPVPYQVRESRKYTPDFVLPNGIVVETKGRFVTADRKKHLLIQAQYPGLEVRFVFSNPNARISKQSKTTYADWCRHKSFQFAKGMIPLSWIHEPAHMASIAILKTLTLL